MSNMLRHKPTGDLYISTAILAARSDMEPVVDEPVAVAVAEDKPKRKTKIKIENPAEPESVLDGVDWGAE
jgi:hypothetical protein